MLWYDCSVASGVSAMSTDTIQTTESVKVKRDYLLDREIEQLLELARKGRHGKRDALIILMSYRHGLRSKEVIDLTWDQVDFHRGTLLVHRAKNGYPSNQPLSGDEMRSLRALKRESESPYILVSERGDKMTTANIRMMFMKLRKLAAASKTKIEGPIHAHALRHACGHKLAEQGVDTRRIQDYLGHKNIQNTRRYTELGPNKFKGFDKLI